MILIFFGPPGAGKGTQASLVAKQIKIPHLSTGQILRNKLKDKDSLSSRLRDTIDSGNLVSDEILNEIITNRLKYKDCLNGFILDGYPRTISQKNFFTNYLKNNNLSISQIFELSLNKQVIIERVKSRQNIEKRKDDKDDVIETRINAYMKETKPLFDFYSLMYPSKYHIINGNQKIEMIYKDIIKIIKK